MGRKEEGARSQKIENTVRGGKAAEEAATLRALTNFDYAGIPGREEIA